MSKDISWNRILKMVHDEGGEEFEGGISDGILNVKYNEDDEAGEYYWLGYELGRAMATGFDPRMMTNVRKTKIFRMLRNFGLKNSKELINAIRGAVTR